jgi:hypothetical protein
MASTHKSFVLINKALVFVVSDKPQNCRAKCSAGQGNISEPDSEHVSGAAGCLHSPTANPEETLLKTAIDLW